ncbi:unnamed protein product [Cylindrotheca closterium]|uniref:Uncharacterized protein n=1 Tax=Cylindrotheca closterium TaxID=2856 RepID=A0AAD2G871_9STRA|nr:unnamed protein product [Cylindrotheca closterium]
MKFSTIIALIASSAAVDAFAPTASYIQISRTSLAVAQSPPSDPELADAIADVRAAAKDFGDETEHFANVWIDRVLSGEHEGVEAGLLDECVIDDSDKCQRFEQALKRLDALLGVGAGEQY